MLCYPATPCGSRFVALFVMSMSVGGEDLLGTPEDEEDHADNDEDFFGAMSAV